MITKTLPSFYQKAGTILSGKPVAENLTQVKKYDYNLEALRGFTALFVVIHHLIGYYDHLDPKYFPGFLHSFQPHGVLRVLMFFVISGYVIGLRNKESLAGSKIWIYLKKRLVRLYPIYAISLLFALVVATKGYSFLTIAGNFTFTQFIFSNLIEENSPIWSLQYEMFYFILFIPISYFNINPITVSVLSILFGLINYFLYPYIGAPVITSYLLGLTFWASGLAIAKYFTKSKTETNYALLISVVPLILCLHKVNIFSLGVSELSDYLGIHSFEFPDSISWFERPITFNDLSYLPYCLMFVLIFTGKEFRFKQWLFNFMFLLPALALIYISEGLEAYGMKKFIALLILYGSSFVLYFYKRNWLNNAAQYLMKGAIWLGSLSYGIFILHFPLLVLFKRIEFFSGSLSTFIIRLTLFLFATILLSFLLEKKFQPWIKRRLL